MTDVFGDRLAELRVRFLGRAAGDSVALIEFASDLARSAPGAPSHAEIRQIAHRLAGAGGTFGFASLSACATKLEALVTDLPDSAELADVCRMLIQEIIHASKQGGHTNGPP